MTVYRLDERIVFPPPEDADPDGLLGAGFDAVYHDAASECLRHPRCWFPEHGGH